MTTTMLPIGRGLALNGHTSALYETALEVLDPVWCFNWSWRPIGDPRWLPTIEGQRIITASRLRRYADLLNNKTWLLGMEFENPKPPSRNPRDAALWLEEQVNELRAVGPDFSFRVIAPNCNITQSGRAWLDEFVSVCQSRGSADFMLGVHLYANVEDHANHHWQAFRQWRESRGLINPVVLTECGSGPGSTVSEATQMLRFWHDICAAHDWLIGYAAYSAYGGVPPNERDAYPGMLEKDDPNVVTKYGHAFMRYPDYPG